MGKSGNKVEKHVRLGKCGKFGKKVSANRAFKKKHGVSYSGRTTGTPDTMKLADLDIPSYEEIAALRDETARRLLIDKGLLHHNRHDLSFKCWSCQAPMDKAGKGYRCSAGRTCKSRPRIEDPLLAFTPFAGYKHRCERPNYVTFVRSAYAFGLRMAPDQAVHMTRTKDTSLVAQTKRIEHLYQKHRIALAFSEYLHAETLKFPTEVVKADSPRFGRGYECGKRIHSGRMLVLKGRQSKQWSSQPLPVKVSKGKRGMGPETVEEVSGPIQKQTPASALLGVDGARAWKGAAAGRIVLGGVNHQTKVFTPASKVSKQKLPAKTKKFLDKQSNGKRKGARMYQRHFRLAGGDNCAEGIFGHLANIMRKTNSRGRHAKPQMRTLQAQSSAALLRRPGFLNVLLAHAKYKEALLTGRLGVSPNQAYNFHQCWWLHPKEDKEASE